MTRALAVHNRNSTSPLDRVGKNVPICGLTARFLAIFFAIGSFVGGDRPSQGISIVKSGLRSAGLRSCGSFRSEGAEQCMRDFPRPNAWERTPRWPAGFRRRRRYAVFCSVPNCPALTCLLQTIYPFRFFVSQNYSLPLFPA